MPFLFFQTLVCEPKCLKVMIYSRRIDLPKEVLHVADENLRGNIDVFVDEIVLTCWITRILGRDGKEVSSPSERKGAFLDQAD